MSPAGYNRLQIGLHWLTALLLLVSFVSHQPVKAAWEAFEKGATEATTGAMVHVATGIAVLALTVLRLGLRFTRGVPAAVVGGSRLTETVSALTHWALLALLLAIPVSGAMLWFGGVEQAGDMHELLFTLGWLLVALHTAAALFHQYVLKDGLLLRMRRPG